MCLTRKPRATSLTPPNPPSTTQKTPAKKKKKSKKKNVSSILSRETRKPVLSDLLKQNKRARSRVNRKLQMQAKTKRKHQKKTNNNKSRNGGYTIDDVKRGLYMMVKGVNVQQTQADTKVPQNSLRRNFLKCLGFKYKPNPKISARRWPHIEKAIANYQLPGWGGSNMYLHRDEEELIVCACEYASNMAFPWSTDQVTSLAWTMMQKLKPGCPCPTKSWLAGFEKRWGGRIHKCKTGSIDAARAKQATAEVRDIVFNKFVAFQTDLLDKGEFTQEQMQDHLEDHIMNVDEVGGDELGKRAKYYHPKVTDKSLPQWRKMEIGGDHNPFHCTQMIDTIVNGKIAPFFSVIHSTPGCKSSRVRSDLLEGVPGMYIVSAYLRVASTIKKMYGLARHLPTHTSHKCRLVASDLHRIGINDSGVVR